MSQRNSDFFEEKKDWSRIKDALLGAYLFVCFQKVIHTKKSYVTSGITFIRMSR